MTCGIKSPIIIKYDTATPKHLIAIAKSNKIATLGHVSLDIAKNDASRPSVRAAHLDKKYKPVPDANAEKNIKKIPGMIPTDAIADGYFREKNSLDSGDVRFIWKRLTMASIPVPRIVFARLITQLSGVAVACCCS